MYVPERMCAICRKRKEKSQLIRIVKVGGTIKIDESGKIDGRGAYICRDKACITKCVKKKVLNKTFKTTLEDSLYEDLARYNIEN